MLGIGFKFSSSSWMGDVDVEEVKTFFLPSIYILTFEIGN